MVSSLSVEVCALSRMTTAQSGSGGGPWILWEGPSHYLSPKVPFSPNVFFGGSLLLLKTTGRLGGPQTVLIFLLRSFLLALMTFLGRLRVCWHLASP